MSGAGVPDFFYREAQRLGYVARSAFKLLQMQKQYKLIKPGSSVLDLGCAPGAWLQSLGPIKNGGVVVGVDIKVLEHTVVEQKVKVPTMYCDSRVQTTSADVMSLPRSQVRALSPQNKGFSVILSDMCPPVSGISTRDAAISIELGMQALDLAVGGTVSAHLRGDDDIQMEVGTEASSSNSDAIGSSSACNSSKPDDEGILKKGGNLVVKLLESQDVQGENIHSPVQSSLLIVKECSDQLTSFPELGLLCKPLFKKASWLRTKATRPSSREIYLICQGFGDKCK